MFMPEKKVEAPALDWNLGEDTDARDDPLLDCLIQLTKLHGHPASRTVLSAGLPLVHNRLTVELFYRAADRADLASRVLKKPLGKIARLQLPVVLLLHEVSITETYVGVSVIRVNLNCPVILGNRFIVPALVAQGDSFVVIL